MWGLSFAANGSDRDLISRIFICQVTYSPQALRGTDEGHYVLPNG